MGVGDQVMRSCRNTASIQHSSVVEASQFADAKWLVRPPGVTANDLEQAIHAYYAVRMKLPLVIHSDPETLGGTPVFVGTRVPVQSLFDHLEAGDSIEDFLEGFPSVQRDQVIAVLEASRKELLQPA